MSWTSPFKINLSGVGDLVNAAKKTIQNAEKTIDKAIGIPDDAGTKKTNETPINNTSVSVDSNNNNNNISAPQEEEKLKVANKEENNEINESNSSIDTSLKESFISPPKESQDFSTSNNNENISQSSNSDISSIPSTPLPVSEIPTNQEINKQSELQKEDNLHTEHVRKQEEKEDIEDKIKERTNEEIEKWKKETERLEKIVKDRERQLEIIIKDNASLREENDVLKSANQQPVNNDIESIKSEFSKRLGDLERKYASLKKERDDLKKQLSSANSENTGNNNNNNSSNNNNNNNNNNYSSLQDIISEKDKEIATLREEGEKLSKKQLGYESSIKKLKTQNTELEKSLKSTKERLENTENLLEQKINKLKELEESTRKYTETLASMKDISEATSKQLEERRKTFESLQTQVSELQAALEKSWIEIAEQKKVNAGLQSKIAASITETESKQKLIFESQLSKHLIDFQDREIQLNVTIKELRASLQRASERAAWREDELNNEIQSLKSRIEAAEGRNEEIVSTVPEATRPLLRQIEYLQASISERSKVWEELERNFTSRLHDAENRLQDALDRERSATSQLNDLNFRIKSLESEISTSRSTQARLQAEAEMERMRADEKDRDLVHQKAQTSAIQSNYERIISELKQNEQKLHNSLLESKDREEKATKEFNLLLLNHKKLLEKKEEKNSLINSNANPFLDSPSKSLRSSTSTENISNQINSLNSQFPSLDKLQGILKQKESEIQTLLSHNSSLEKTKDLLQDELVKVTSRAESLASEISGLKDLKSQMDDLKKRYNAALEMIGEKEEQLEDLRADIEDLKTLYKTQISELLLKIESKK